MNIAFAYLIGIGLPAISGWLLLGILERVRGTLDRIEHWTAGAVVGMTVSMLVMFCANVALGIPLSRTGWLAVQGILLIVLAVAWWFLQPSGPMPEETIHASLPKWLRIMLWILVGWVVVKMLFTGIVFLFLTPTYLDDSITNWDLRGKMFYEDQRLTLAMPGIDPAVSMQTVGSYPPALPMTKAWLASLAGSWSDPVANGIHLFYYIAALLLLARTVRRFAGKGWDLFAVYLLGSMPLYLMHGTNAYADAFMSVHVLLAVIFPLRAMMEMDPGKRAALFRIGAFCAALLPFTKNEGVLVYLPPLLLIGAIGLWIGVRRERITSKEAWNVIAWYVGCLVVVALPWLAFKWIHGLTFGNAKPVGTLAFTWQSGVLLAIFVNTFFEGNWLLFFPLLIGLLLWRRRAAFGRWSPLTAYVGIVYLGQCMIFLFTSLSIEARMQTGIARGNIQLMPSFVLLCVLLLADAAPILRRASLAMGRSVGIVRA